ncbi:ricin-type beta-trefoil lectin domain protein [Peterkaempfera sp. SMS 1(5)a]|uniref:ricin-type beta-trefoil lectin domain protein n=1 Tax=Peterkaempfera podocarpi TaxID=3232308 RepID=UPI00366E7950
MKRILLTLVSALALAVGLGQAPAFAAAQSITPGTIWTDSSNNVLEAHGEGILQVGSTYYWFGEDKTGGSVFQNVNCYSSTDLKHWTFVNHVLTRQSSGDLGPNRIVERPHVIYNASTSSYVMWMHIDDSNYDERKAGVATSSSVCGAYTYRGSSKPLGNDSLDDNLFLDGTAAYFMSEDRTDKKLQVYRLSSDYLSVASLADTLPQYEAPAMVKVGGTYFMFGSRLTGWSTNDNQYATASSITGAWSSWKSFAPSGTNTCNSQTTSILPITGSSGTSYLFLGDRWNSGTLSDSRYIWEPLTISGTSASISCHSAWTVDTSTGSVAVVNPDTTGTSIIRGVQSNRCMDVQNASTGKGAAIDLYDCNGGSNQSWTLNSSKELVVYGTMCLDVPNQSTSSGTKLEIYTCNGGGNQQWVLKDDGTITGVQSGLCLDATSGATTNGTLLEIYTCNGGSNQKWVRQ